MSPLDFDFAAPTQRHSHTSIEAAERIETKRDTLRNYVLDALRKFGPATDEELTEWTGIPASTCRPRRIECVQMGLAEDSGKTKTGKSGRQMTLWRAR